jgi:hypothetical protein
MAIQRTGDPSRHFALCGAAVALVRVTLVYFGRAETVERRRSRRRASRIWRRALLLVGKGALVAMLRGMDLCVS